MLKKLAVLLLCLYFGAAGQVCAGTPASLKGKTVAVDPGHGGYDPGAVRNGVLEKDINLQIALKLRESLEKKGAAVTMTRNGDYNLAVAGLHKREAHRYDLKKRLEAAEKSGAGVFVSVHVNCICSRSHGGAEAFYLHGSEKGRLLAECIQKQLNGIPGSRKRRVKTSRCYVLRNANMPAVLVEVGYLSNPGEREKLQQDDYQKCLADNITEGLANYFSIGGGG